MRVTPNLADFSCKLIAGSRVLPLLTKNVIFQYFFFFFFGKIPIFVECVFVDCVFLWYLRPEIIPFEANYKMDKIRSLQMWKL